jgi:hypothetical protein
MDNQKNNPTNPAGRLLEILKRAKTVSGPTIANGFVQVFAIGSDDVGELFRRLSLLVEQTEQVSTLLKVSGNDRFHSTYLESLPRIKAIFIPRHLDGPWDQHVKQTIQESYLRDLQYCSNLLSGHFVEDPVDDDQL